MRRASAATSQGEDWPTTGCSILHTRTQAAEHFHQNPVICKRQHIPRAERITTTPGGGNLRLTLAILP
jgi:hypothetical protein